MEYCPLCQFEMSRNLCMQCIENFEDTGMDRDEAEEAYLAAVPDEDEDEEDDEPEIKRYSFPVTVTVYAEGTSPDEASTKAFNALCAASEAMGEVDFEFDLGDADPEEEESW